MFDMLDLWLNLGYDLETIEEPQYIINFIKNGKIEGYIKVLPGGTLKWDYPQELMNARRGV